MNLVKRIERTPSGKPSQSKTSVGISLRELKVKFKNYVKLKLNGRVNLVKRIES